MAHPTITIGLLPVVDELVDWHVLVDWQRRMTVGSNLWGQSKNYQPISTERPEFLH